jgi:hypothetical protein
LSRAHAAPTIAPFCTWSAEPIGCQLVAARHELVQDLDIVVLGVEEVLVERLLERHHHGRDRARTPPSQARLQAASVSKDGAHDEHPPARDEMLQVVREALNVLAPLLLEALDFDDLRD